jgi:hypothetical protein
MSYFCALTTLKSFALTFFFYRFVEEGFLPVAAEKEDLLVMMVGKEDFASVEILPHHHLL